jgi:hypothetical protein
MVIAALYARGPGHFLGPDAGQAVRLTRTPRSKDRAPGHRANVKGRHHILESSTSTTATRASTHTATKIRAPASLKATGRPPGRTGQRGGSEEVARRGLLGTTPAPSKAGEATSRVRNVSRLIPNATVPQRSALSGVASSSPGRSTAPATQAVVKRGLGQAREGGNLAHVQAGLVEHFGPHPRVT